MHKLTINIQLTLIDSGFKKKILEISIKYVPK